MNFRNIIWKLVGRCISHCPEYRYALLFLNKKDPSSVLGHQGTCTRILCTWNMYDAVIALTVLQIKLTQLICALIGIVLNPALISITNKVGERVVLCTCVKKCMITSMLHISQVKTN